MAEKGATEVSQAWKWKGTRLQLAKAAAPARTGRGPPRLRDPRSGTPLRWQRAGGRQDPEKMITPQTYFARTGVKSRISSWPLSVTSGQKPRKTTSWIDRGRGGRACPLSWHCRCFHGIWSFSKAWVIFLCKGIKLLLCIRWQIPSLCGE